MKTLRDIQALPNLGSLINGTWSHAGETFEVLNKYTHEIFARVHSATDAESARAVQTARAAMEAKGRGDAYARKQVLRRAGDLLQARRSELLPVLIAEAGFTADDANGEIDRACITLDLAAEAGVRLCGDLIPFAACPGAHTRFGYTQRFPIGVVCAITPFNAPLNTVLHKVAPAYAGGNAVILKPSAYTPLTSAFLGEILLDAGMEPDFLSILQGEGDTVGMRLLNDQDVAFYNFTGSTRVGRIIQNAAGLRRTQMELGSIASTIICDDADLEKALDRVATAGLRKAGQVCTSVQHLYVHRSLQEQAAEGLVARAARMKAGDPADPDTRVGPMISELSAIRAEEWIQEAVRGGAHLLCGGTREGSVLAPTLLTQVPHQASAWCKEIFAPVMAIEPFDDFEEALRGANNTPFGLSAGVFTRSLEKAMLATQSLRFGTIMINQTSSARSDVMPFGGVKASGFGKEGPDYAIQEMTEQRLVVFNP